MFLSGSGGTPWLLGHELCEWQHLQESGWVFQREVSLHEEPGHTGHVVAPAILLQLGDEGGQVSWRAGAPTRGFTLFLAQLPDEGSVGLAARQGLPQVAQEIPQLNAGEGRWGQGRCGHEMAAPGAGEQVQFSAGGVVQSSGQILAPREHSPLALCPLSQLPQAGDAAGTWVRGLHPDTWWGALPQGALPTCSSHGGQTNDQLDTNRRALIRMP